MLAAVSIAAQYTPPWTMPYGWWCAGWTSHSSTCLSGPASVLVKPRRSVSPPVGICMSGTLCRVPGFQGGEGLEHQQRAVPVAVHLGRLQQCAQVIAEVEQLQDPADEVGR